MTLFAHLAIRLGKHPENLAVDALGYILDHSAIAAETLSSYLGDTGVAMPDGLHYRIQATGTDDPARPDLEAVQDGATRALIEAKFAAGLTINQPVGYLKRLAGGTPGVLLFIAPGQRFVTLWNELSVRCQQAGFTFSGEDRAKPEYWHVQLPDGHALALTSWRALLAVLSRATRQAGEHNTAIDIDQLASLCERMDSEAFLPLDAEEISSAILPRRYLELSALPSDMVEAALKAKVGFKTTRDGKGLYSSFTYGYNGRFMRLVADHQIYVEFDSLRWLKFGRTPFWIRIAREDPVRDKRARERLQPLKRRDPPLLLEDDDELYVPIDLEHGLERDAIIQRAVRRIAEINDLLAQDTPAIAEST